MTQTLNVTERNVEEARQYVRNGPEAHPGANYVRRPDDGRRLKVTEKNCEELAEKVEPDWEVNRHLVDGDIVIFNRQPSLHRMSIMAHEVVVMPYKTFRLNTVVCPPYNADFDGDEMNMHALQNEGGPRRGARPHARPRADPQRRGSAGTSSVPSRTTSPGPTCSRTRIPSSRKRRRWTCCGRPESTSCCPRRTASTTRDASTGPAGRCSRSCCPTTSRCTSRRRLAMTSSSRTAS